MSLYLIAQLLRKQRGLAGQYLLSILLHAIT